MGRYEDATCMFWDIQTPGEVGARVVKGAKEKRPSIGP